MKVSRLISWFLSRYIHEVSKTGLLLGIIILLLSFSAARTSSLCWFYLDLTPKAWFSLTPLYRWVHSDLHCQTTTESIPVGLVNMSTKNIFLWSWLQLPFLGILLRTKNMFKKSNISTVLMTSNTLTWRRLCCWIQMHNFPITSLTQFIWKVQRSV